MPAENMSSIGPAADVNQRIAALDAERARLKLLDAETKANEKLMKARSDLSIKEAKVTQGLNLESGREKFFQDLYMGDRQNAMAKENREDQQAFAAEQGAASRAFQETQNQQAREAGIEDREDQQQFAKEQTDEARIDRDRQLEDARAREDEQAQRKLDLAAKKREIELDVLAATKDDEAAIRAQQDIFEETISLAEEQSLAGKKLVEAQGEAAAALEGQIRNVVIRYNESLESKDAAIEALSEEVDGSLEKIQEEAEAIYEDLVSRKSVVDPTGVMIGPAPARKIVPNEERREAGRKAAKEVRRRVVKTVVDSVQEAIGDSFTLEEAAKTTEVINGIVKAVEVSQATGEDGLSKDVMAEVLPKLDALKAELGAEALDIVMTTVSESFIDLSGRFKEGIIKAKGEEREENLGGQAIFGNVARVIQEVSIQSGVSYESGMQALQEKAITDAIVAEDPIASLERVMRTFRGTPEEENIQSLLTKFKERDKKISEYDEEEYRLRNLAERYNRKIARLEEDLDNKREVEKTKRELEVIEGLIQRKESDAEGSNQGDSGSAQRERTVFGSDPFS